MRWPWVSRKRFDERSAKVAHLCDEVLRLVKEANRREDMIFILRDLWQRQQVTIRKLQIEIAKRAIEASVDDA